MKKFVLAMAALIFGLVGLSAHAQTVVPPVEVGQNVVANDDMDLYSIVYYGPIVHFDVPSNWKCSGYPRGSAYGTLCSYTKSVADQNGTVTQKAGLNIASTYVAGTKKPSGYWYQQVCYQAGTYEMKASFTAPPASLMGGTQGLKIVRGMGPTYPAVIDWKNTDPSEPPPVQFTIDLDKCEYVSVTLRTAPDKYNTGRGYQVNSVTITRIK